MGTTSALLIALGLLLMWLTCGICAYGLTFAYFQRQWPALAEEKYGSDFKFALLTGTLGPFGLYVSLLDYGTRHGFKWK